MKLCEYIKPLSHEGKCALAGEVGTNYAYLMQLAGGHSVPSARLARKLSDATGGQVSAWELRPDIFDPPHEASIAPA